MPEADERDGGWFPGWVRSHCDRTGAGADVARTLAANRGVILDPPWSATAAEMHEVTDRLVRESRVPKFADDHIKAVGVELFRLREEVAARDRAAAPGDFAPDCGACGGSGLATVPHPSCLWDRRLVLPRGYKTVLPAAVLCDRCGAGRLACERERARKDGDCRPTLTAYDRRHGVDSVALLREWERSQAKAARRSGPGLPHGAGDWSQLVAALLAKAREATNSAA